MFYGRSSSRDSTYEYHKPLLHLIPQVERHKSTGCQALALWCETVHIEGAAPQNDRARARAVFDRVEDICIREAGVAYIFRRRASTPLPTVTSRCCLNFLTPRNLQIAEQSQGAGAGKKAGKADTKAQQAGADRHDWQWPPPGNKP